MVDLPTHLLIELLSRLPIKSVLLCRCVCKLWLDLLSTPHFANLYASTAPKTLLLQPPNICTSRTNLRTSHLFHLREYTNRSTHFMLPFKPSTNLPNLNFCFVTSCNGLLSLYDPQTNDPIYVCNPISGEFVTLPKSSVASSRIVAHGFGFAPRSEKYKVIRVVQEGHGRVIVSHTVQVYTLGEGAWRSLGDACKFPHRVAYNTFLNGVLHWDTYYDEPYVCFDFDTEKFGVIDGPRVLDQTNMQKRSLGVLGNCLSVCCFENPAQIEIWVMKNYGMKESWTKQYVIESTKEFILQNSISKRSPGLLYCELVMILESGEILMLFDKRSLVICDPKLQCFRLLTPFAVEDAKFEAVAYVPTLVSLNNVAGKEIIMRCAG